MGEQMSNGDSLFALIGEFRNESTHTVVELELSQFPKPGDGNICDGFSDL